MVRPSAPRLIAVAALATLACSDDSSTSDIPAECNPLDGTTCMLPWPSAAYEVADPSTPTGVRLALPAGAGPFDALPTVAQATALGIASPSFEFDVVRD